VNHEQLVAALQQAVGRGERFAEQDVPILAALALIDPDLARFQVHIGYEHPAQLAEPIGQLPEKDSNLQPAFYQPAVQL